ALTSLRLGCVGIAIAELVYRVFPGQESELTYTKKKEPIAGSCFRITVGVLGAAAVFLALDFLFSFALGVIIGLPNGVLHFARDVLDLAFRLLHCAFSLMLFAACPFACLAFDSAGNVLRFALEFVFFHSSPPYSAYRRYSSERIGKRL